MPSKNAQTVKTLIAAFNKKDLDGVAACYAEQCVLIDHARNETVKGRTGARGNSQMWLTAFPDGKIEEVRIVDGGETIALHFVGRGKNDGPMGPFPATGKRVSLPYSQFLTFDASGKIVEEDDYYDMMGLLVQTGQAKPPM